MYFETAGEVFGDASFTGDGGGGAGDGGGVAGMVGGATPENEPELERCGLVGICGNVKVGCLPDLGLWRPKVGEGIVGGAGERIVGGAGEGIVGGAGVGMVTCG